jgi:hypothetical protein
MSIRFNLPSAKKPIVRLSGDQNGWVASSVPGRGWAAVVLSARTHKRDTPSDVAAYTTFSPFWEIASDSGSGVGGVAMSTRISAGGGTC